jgi:hypothetical protein
MTPVHLQQHDGNAVITFLSEDKLVEIAFTLKFTEERLQFDYGRGIRVEDDGSGQACLNAAEVTRFVRDYIGNGRLNFFDSDSRELIARVDAFMPVNYTANHEGFAQRIAELMAEAEKRTADPGGSA